jgi:hypothetical protein
MVPKPDETGRRSYAVWSGSPKGTPEDITRCVESVYDGGRSMIPHQCYRKRGFGTDGLYCKQHDPDTVKKREQDRTARYNEQMAKQSRGWLAEELGKLLMDAGFDTRAKVAELLSQHKA